MACDLQRTKVRVNRLGLRGGETTPRPAPDHRRLLVLGDSVVFGQGLEEADTFPVLLERALAAKGGSATEVLNGGVPGYNTATEVAFLERFGLPLAPDAVVLGVSLNDYSDAPVMTASGLLTNELDARTRLPWLTNHSELYLLARWTAVYLRGAHPWQRLGEQAPAAATPVEERWAALDRAVAAMHKQFYAAPAGPGWERTRAALGALRDLTRGHGLALTAIVFPDRDQVELPAPDLDPQRRWLELCDAVGIRCVDLAPAFRAAAAPNGSLFQDTQHPNAAGMRVAAQAVADALGR